MATEAEAGMSQVEQVAFREGTEMNVLLEPAGRI